MDRVNRRHLVIFAILMVACWVAAGIVGASWFRAPLDLFHNLLLPRAEEGRAPPTALSLSSSRVVLVDVSVDQGEGSPIAPRPTLADVIQKLGDLGAWAIGVDILFENPTNPVIDARLESAIRSARRVVLATRYERKSLQEVRPRFADAAGCLGIANIVVDSYDGYFRMVQHYYDQPGIETRFSLSLQMSRLMLAEGSLDLAPVVVRKDGLTIKGAAGEALDVPFDRQGMSLIQYQGPAGTIPQVPWRQLVGMTRKQLDLTGRAVLVGDTRLVTRDAYLTPFHRGDLSRISGVEVHAQNLLGMLSGSWRRTTTLATDWATALAGVALVAALSRLAPVLALLGLVLILVVLTWFASYLAFTELAVFVNPLPGTVGAAFSLLVTLVLAPGVRRARRDAAPMDPRLVKAVELLEQGQVDRSVEGFQALLPADGTEADPTVRWGLAMAFLALNKIELALPHIGGLKTDTLPLERLYALAETLERIGALCEAEDLFRQILARNLGFRDAAERAQVLSSRDPRVPDSLRRTLVHRYTDISFLASGGMGRIYRALDRQREEYVAVKVPDLELLKDRDVKKRFIRETDLLMKLTHPHIVRLFDVGPEEMPFYAMELIEGETLKELLDREWRLSIPRALRLLGPVASALGFSHSKGVIHRDVKPENILLDAQEVARLTDFGLAFLADRTRLTRLSVNVGTPMYMAPEQMEGSPPSPAMDVYALGAVLYETIGGKQPYRTDSAVSKLVEDAIPLNEYLPEVPRELEKLIHACLSRDPTRRPADGTVLCQSLEAQAASLGG
ncbi:MAG: protein kinase [Candidatus Riflebacteria bacterium]|nr:protein kinase [Candidatus Riflebacteria bacterium]